MSTIGDITLYTTRISIIDKLSNFLCNQILSAYIPMAGFNFECFQKSKLLHHITAFW